MNEALSRFKALSPVGQAAIVGVTAWNLWLTVTSERDLQRRSSDEVRGPKLLWTPALSVQPVGPIAYLVWGRKR